VARAAPPEISRLKGPPFRADQVGSLLRPPALKAARAAFRQGRLPASDLAHVEEEAIAAIVRRQEEIGLRSVTDGEFRRGSWSGDFIAGIAGVARATGGITTRFHRADGTLGAAPPGFRIEARLGRPKPIFLDAFRTLAAVTRAVPKLTIPSPTMLHFRGGRAAVDATAYPDIEAFYEDLARIWRAEIADLAAAGCRYLQIDETNFAYLCDPALRDEVRHNLGEDPDRLPGRYATLINQAIAGRPADMVVCLHLCRGNSESAWIAEGGYEPVAETLFNAVAADGYFLEYDSPRAGDFAPLRFVPKNKRIVLGLVTTKRPELEAKDDLKRRIEAASRYLPLDQLALSPQCGFASTEAGNLLSEEDQFAKLRLIVALAEEIWG
jgi:5-methyltetrahydropteroyltriglutamate--homocysteine methyltransferase